MFGNDPAKLVPQTAYMASRNHLRAWRTFRGMTQEQLANAVDTTKGVISQIESGDRGLSGKWLNRLAPVLGTTPGFLLDHDPNDLPTAFLDVINEIPEDRRDLALDVLKRFRTGTEG